MTEVSSKRRDRHRGLSTRARIALLGESVRMAFGALRANKLRTALTLLGMVIGVSTVIIMAAVLSGLDRSMAEGIAALGTGNILVTRYEAGFHVGGTMHEIRPDITNADAEAIARECPSVAAVSPNVGSSEVVLWERMATKRIAIRGAGADYPLIEDRAIERGRSFTAAEALGRTRVCVMGSAVAEVLFGAVDPVGQRVRIGEWSYEVIGLLAAKGKVLGEDLDEVVYVPVATLQSQRGWGSIADYISVRPTSPRAVQTALEETEQLLRRRRGLRADEESNFALSTQDSLLAMYNNLTRAIYGVMLLVSAIGLLVGGIGIMNMMLVSVKERTREIGVRRALGAQRRDILLQFLAEAVTLTLTGGAAGIALGALLAGILAAATPLPAVIPPAVVAIALGVSVATGVFFGLYPAWRASRQSPIEALRYE
jgi:putative ABC transport system permease protein